MGGHRRDGTPHHLEWPCSSAGQNRLQLTKIIDLNHALSAFEAIHRAFTGNLWMPPVALDS
jgi:hypothetical protein